MSYSFAISAEGGRVDAWLDRLCKPCYALGVLKELPHERELLMSNVVPFFSRSDVQQVVSDPLTRTFFDTHVDGFFVSDIDPESIVGHEEARTALVRVVKDVPSGGWLVSPGGWHRYCFDSLGQMGWVLSDTALSKEDWETRYVHSLDEAIKIAFDVAPLIADDWFRAYEHN